MPLPILEEVSERLISLISLCLRSNNVLVFVGSWGDMTTFSGLVKHVLRSEYGTFKLGVRDGKEDVLKRLLLSFEHASLESGHILWPLTMVHFPCNLLSLSC